jgi:hypothetical protein
VPTKICIPGTAEDTTTEDQGLGHEVLEGQEVRTTGGRADCLYEKQTKERVGEGAGGDRRNGFWVLEGFFDSVLLCVRSRKLHLS